MKNPFARKPANPLDALSEDELRAARKKLEYARERIHRQVRELEAQKGRLILEGQQSDARVRRDKAYQVLTLEEQLNQLDQQLKGIAKEIQFISRVTFLKQNSAQVGTLVIDQLLGKIDTGRLRVYLEELQVRGAAGSERLSDLVDMFNRDWESMALDGSEPDLDRVLALMEPPMPAPEVPGAQPVTDASSQEPGNAS